MASVCLRAKACVCVLACAAGIIRPAAASERARLEAALDDRRVSSSIEGLHALGEEATSFEDPEVRIAAWLYVAEGLSERAGLPVAGATYAQRALADPAISAVDRGRAVVLLVGAREAEGDADGALALAERESSVTPGLARRLRIHRRSEGILSVSRCVLVVLGSGGVAALAMEVRRGSHALRALARRVVDGPVLIAAALIAAIAPLLARAFDPAAGCGPFFRLAAGILLVHATLAAGHRYLHPPLAVTLAVGSFAAVGAWAYLAGACPLPAWAEP